MRPELFVEENAGRRYWRRAMRRTLGSQEPALRAPEQSRVRDQRAVPQGVGATARGPDAVPAPVVAKLEHQVAVVLFQRDLHRARLRWREVEVREDVLVRFVPQASDRGRFLA